MKQRNFVTTALQPEQDSMQSLDTVRTKRTFNLFGAIAGLYTRYTEWTARRNRVKICRTVAKAFRTDMESVKVKMCTAISAECGDMTQGPKANYGTGFHTSADGRQRPNPPAGWKWAGK